MVGGPLKMSGCSTVGSVFRSLLLASDERAEPKKKQRARDTSSHLESYVRDVLVLVLDDQEHTSTGAFAMHMVWNSAERKADFPPVRTSFR